MGHAVFRRSIATFKCDPYVGMGIRSSSEIGDDENPLVVDIKRLDRIISRANGKRGRHDRHDITDEYIQERIKERDQKIRNLLDMIKNKSYKHGLSIDDIKIYKRNILTKNRNRYKKLANALQTKKWYEEQQSNMNNSRYKLILGNIQEQINDLKSSVKDNSLEEDNLSAEDYREKQLNINAQLKNLNKVERPTGVTINKFDPPQRHIIRGGNRTYCTKRRPSCITHRRKGS